MNRVVLFSGGIGSFFAAVRARRAMSPSDRLILLFTDTTIEDPDLYRFLEEAAAAVPGAELVTIADGRSPWELFDDEGMIGNTRADICSRILKRDLARSWLDENLDPAEWAIVVGIDWSEAHRLERMRPRWEPWKIEAPLCDPPYRMKPELLEELETEFGIRRPALYGLGFPHNNCGGFCVKAGHGGFELLLRLLPERFAEHEAAEESFRRRHEKDVAILRDRRGGVTRPFPLSELRRRSEERQDQMSLEELLETGDVGGCGCFVDEEGDPDNAD